MTYRSINEFNSLIDDYIALIRKYHKCFEVNVVSSLSRDCETLIEDEIKRIESVVIDLESYMSNLTKYVENGLEYSFSEGYEVVDDLSLDQLALFETEIERVKGILEK